MKANQDNQTFKNTSFFSRIFPFIVALLILALGIWFSSHLIKTKPKAKPKQRPVRHTIVHVAPIALSSEQTTLTAMGNVIAAREIDLKPQVNGEVISMSESMVPGGHLKKGDQILTIDPTDYELIILQLESDVAKASSELALEMGYQKIAKKEFELLGEQASEDEKKLMLRNPQLISGQASLKTAKAKLKKAQIDLSRTNITSPFNAAVLSRYVNTGAKVTTSTTLARLVETDFFWIELLLPVEKLEYLKFPDSGSDNNGSTVRIYPSLSSANDKAYRTGRIVRMAPDLEENGRMAKIYVEIEDPLCLQKDNVNKPRLFLGAYVHATIEGNTLQDVIKLNRSYLRDGDTVWLMSKNNVLKIVQADVIFRQPDSVLIRNTFSKDAKLITSHISVPVEGMPLQLPGQIKSGEKMKKNSSGQSGGDKREQ